MSEEARPAAFLMIPAFRILSVTFVALGAAGIAIAAIQGMGIASVITLLAWVPLGYLIFSRTKGPKVVSVALHDVEIRSTQSAACWLVPRMAVLLLPPILVGFVLPYWAPAAAGFTLGLATRVLVLGGAFEKRQQIDDVVWLLRIGRWRRLAALQRCVAPAPPRDGQAIGSTGGTGLRSASAWLAENQNPGAFDTRHSRTAPAITFR